VILLDNLVFLFLLMILMLWTQQM